MKAFSAIIVMMAAVLTCSVSFAAKVNGLGNDYEVYDFGSYNPDAPWLVGSSYNDPANNNWYIPAHQYKNPVYLYQLNPSLVQAQLRNMRASGVDVLVLHMSTDELAGCEASGACYTPYNDGVWGNVTDVSQAALRPQQAQNLQAILQYAVSQGFRKIFLRFNTGMINDWTSWNEGEYQKQWNFILSTRNLAAQVTNRTGSRLMVDLGGEQIGFVCDSSNPTCQRKAYVQRLWSDYVTAFGNSDTVGFSFVGCSWVVKEGISWFGSIKPSQYAFDIYATNSICSSGPTIQSDLTDAWNALGTEKSKPIMLMETYSNDQQNASAISATLNANPSMVLTDVVQWPLDRAPTCQGCDANIHGAPVSALSSTSQVSNYLPIAANAAVDNLNPALLMVDGSGCNAGSPSTYVKFNVGYAPQGTATVWQVWVTVNNNTRQPWSCNAGNWGGSNALTTTWLVKGNSYRFDYYKAAACSTTPAVGSESAVSYVSLR